MSNPRGVRFNPIPQERIVDRVAPVDEFSVDSHQHIVPQPNATRRGHTRIIDQLLERDRIHPREDGIRRAERFREIDELPSQQPIDRGLIRRYNQIGRLRDGAAIDPRSRIIVDELDGSLGNIGARGNPLDFRPDPASETGLGVIDTRCLHGPMNIAPRLAGSDDGPRSMYTIEKVLGRGGFGVVLHVTKDGTDEEYALKVLQRWVHKKNGPRDYTEMILNEIRIHSYMTHDNIIRLHEAFVSDTHAFMVMELADSSLGDRHVDLQNMSEDRIAELIRQITMGLDYCHNFNVVHRDIKRSNILLKDGVAKIADFGLSCSMNDRDGLDNTVGTPGYQAPELQNIPERGLTIPTAVDYYALGVTLYRLVFQEYPRFRTGLFGQGTVVFSQRSVGSRAVRNLICGLLRRNPRMRYNANSVLNHRWMNRVPEGSQRQGFPRGRASNRRFWR